MDGGSWKVDFHDRNLKTFNIWIAQLRTLIPVSSSLPGLTRTRRQSTRRWASSSGRSRCPASTAARGPPCGCHASSEVSVISSSTPRSELDQDHHTLNHTYRTRKQKERPATSIWRHILGLFQWPVFRGLLMWPPTWWQQSLLCETSSKRLKKWQKWWHCASFSEDY